MLLPENEARFKFCPMLKTSDDRLKFCQVSGCMMWRWADKDLGFCGMAGLPLSLKTEKDQKKT